MATKPTNPETRRVRYLGDMPSASHPMLHGMQVKRGDVIEVPAHVRLCAHWFDEKAPEPQTLEPVKAPHTIAGRVAKATQEG